MILRSKQGFINLDRVHLFNLKLNKEMKLDIEYRISDDPLPFNVELLTEQIDANEYAKLEERFSIFLRGFGGQLFDPEVHLQSIRYLEEKNTDE